MEEKLQMSYERLIWLKLKHIIVMNVMVSICTMNEIDEDHEGFETGTLNAKASRKV